MKRFNELGFAELIKKGGGHAAMASESQYHANISWAVSYTHLMDQAWYQNASVGAGDFEQSPYWLINKAPNEDTRYRAMFNLSVKYQFNKLFSLQARGSAD